MMFRPAQPTQPMAQGMAQAMGQAGMAQDIGWQLGSVARQPILLGKPQQPIWGGFMQRNGLSPEQIAQMPRPQNIDPGFTAGGQGQMPQQPYQPDAGTAKRWRENNQRATQGYNAQGAQGGMAKIQGGRQGQRGPMSAAGPDLKLARQNARGR